LDPSESETYHYLAKTYEFAERPGDALAAAQRGVNADSLSAGAAAELANALYFMGRYEEALAQLAKVTAVRPPLRRTPAYIAEANAALGRWSDAIAVLRPVDGREPSGRGLLGFALARSGARADAQQLLNQMLAEEGVGLAPAYGIAEVYIGLGDYDRAFVWLDRAFDDYSLSPRIMGPLFRDFRADPRFERVRRRLGTLRPQHP
jgi:tetratricopeptide (TPR) repeat protein